MKKTILTAITMTLILAGTADADQQILDDTVVDGSLCVGFDCVNGESFGFNTLVLKENNVRLRFHDTSTSASFPTTDWLIEANSSQNGGGSYFAVVNLDDARTPFSIDRSARNGGLIVNGVGVGLGVEPQVDLHALTGDTPVFRLQQDGTQGWTPATWDIGANESNFFIRDVEAATAPVRIVQGAVTDALVVEANGDLSVSGVVNTGSSRSIKFGVVPVEPAEVLDRVSGLEVSRWQYIADDRGAQHIGPMAEDFHRAFGLGADDRHIAALDLAGVAISSVQALNDRVGQQARQIKELQGANADLQARLERIEAALARR